MKGPRHTPCPANGLRPAANGVMSPRQPAVTFLAMGAGKALDEGNARTHTHTKDDDDDVSIVSIILTLSPSYPVMGVLSVGCLLTPSPGIKFLQCFL